MKTAMEIADGFPRGGHRVRAQNLVKTAKTEGFLEAADEIEKLLVKDDPAFIVGSVQSWVRAVREIAEKEEKE